jgi:hypothetical protein
VRFARPLVGATCRGATDLNTPASPVDTAEAPPRVCANCGQAFALPPPNFCPNCGQESRVRAPRLVDFLQQFGGAYLSTEGALWRTLKLLLLKPGELTLQYLAGKRRHYVLPLRLYLTISVLALLLLRATATINVDLKPDEAAAIAKENRQVILNLGPGRAGLRDGVFFCEQLPGWVCKRVQRRIDVDPSAMVSQIEGLKDRFLGNLGAAMFVLLPAFALGLKGVYMNRRLHYTEHLVFALHVHAFWFGALALAMILSLTPLPALQGVCLGAVPIYTLLAMRRVYGGRWWPRLLRAALVCLMYVLVLGFAVAFLMVWALLS